MVKNPPANPGDIGSILGSGRSPREGKWQPTPAFLSGKTPWTEEPGWQQSMGLQRAQHDLAIQQQSFIMASYRVFSLP